MAETKVKRENYITIQGFMLTDLNLKGNELIIYACIYGFSQAENHTFSGSLQYLADWTNSTKQGVVRNLKSLVEKGYIIKEDKVINGVKFCEYHTTKLNTVYNKVEQGIQQSLIPPMQQSLINNIVIDNIVNNTVNNTEIYKDIVEYLNKKAKTQYRDTTPKTRTCINARMNEGFTVEDFKKVIDNKVADWLGTDMERFLRPETLFGTKFEGYLNAPSVKQRNGEPVQDEAKAELYKRIKENYTV